MAIDGRHEKDPALKEGVSDAETRSLIIVGEQVIYDDSNQTASCCLRCLTLAKVNPDAPFDKICYIGCRIR